MGYSCQHRGGREHASESPDRLLGSQHEELREVAAALHRGRDELAKHGSLPPEPPMVRAMIARLLTDRGQPLTDEAWEAIESQENLEVLHVLATLAADGSPGLAFHQVRRAVFENPVVRSFVIEAARGTR